MTKLIIFSYSGAFILILVVRHTQNNLCIQRSLMQVVGLQEQLLDSGMNSHTVHSGMVEVHLQQPIILIIHINKILPAYSTWFLGLF